MRKRYPSDISKEAFEEIRPLLERVRKQTKPRTIDLYEVFCGVLYLLKSGCQWRMLPSEYPKWRTVHAYFAKWSEPGPDGFSVLERALKKCGWRGSYKTGAQILDELFSASWPMVDMSVSHLPRPLKSCSALRFKSPNAVSSTPLPSCLSAGWWSDHSPGSRSAAVYGKTASASSTPAYSSFTSPSSRFCLEDREQVLKAIDVITNDYT